jgi:hypothetical protein
MSPSKTFFGLDKSAAHCFTLPKSMYYEIIQLFHLKEGNLQVAINLLIDGKTLPAIVRLARQDRSKPIKLEKNALPKRDVIQFNWKGKQETIQSIRTLFANSYIAAENGFKNRSEYAIFTHVRDSYFAVFSRKKGQVQSDLSSMKPEKNSSFVEGNINEDYGFEDELFNLDD